MANVIKWVGMIVTMCLAMAANAEMDKKAVQQEIANYIQEHPEAIVKSLEKFYERAQASAQKQVQATLTKEKKALTKDADALILGNPNGSKVVIEFFDYLCSYCKKAHPTLTDIIKKHNDVKVILKPLPILSPFSERLTQAMLVIYHTMGQETFSTIHAAIMEGKPLNITSEEEFKKLLTTHRINYAEIESQMDGKRYKAAIQSNKDLAQKLQVRGVPCFIIDDKLYPGLLDKATIEKALKLES